MKNNSQRLIFAVLIIAAAHFFCADIAAQESYPLMCRGVKGAEIGFETGSRMSFKFKKGTAKADSGADPASSGLAPGECSWSDRGMRDSEPDIFFHKVEDGMSLSDAEYKWTSELDNPDNYWVFDIAKNGDGQFTVLAARRARRIANLPQNPRPTATPRPDEAEMPDSNNSKKGSRRRPSQATEKKDPAAIEAIVTPCGPNNLQHVKGPTCAGSNWTYSSCEWGYEDLDGNSANGCETPSPLAAGRLDALDFWMRADRGLRTSGPWDKDQGWEGLVGKSRRTLEPNFNGSGRPSVYFNVVFDGVMEQRGDFLVHATYTIFAVIARAGDKRWNYFLSLDPDYNETNRLKLGFRDETTFTFAQGSSIVEARVPESKDRTQYFNVVARLDETSGHQLYLNGVLVGANSNKELIGKEDKTKITELLIGGARGADPYGGDFAAGDVGRFHQFDGYIAEIIIFSVALTDGQRTLVENYLEKKWNPTSKS
ncbi:MAG TPA: hypothetical protein VF899_03450 [Pyrinomonadaceae bacterium]